jgi:hypothetical protein
MLCITSSTAEVQALLPPLAMFRDVQTLRFSTSAAAADGLTRDPAAHGQQLTRELACGSNLLQALADLITALRSPDAEVIAASAAAAGAIEALERVMRGEVGGADVGAAQALAAVALTRFMPHNGGQALARFITDKGDMIVGQGRGCGAAAPLKAFSSTGHTCASFLAEGRSALHCEEWVGGNGLLCCSCVKSCCATSCTGRRKARRDGGAQGGQGPSCGGGDAEVRSRCRRR